MSFSPNQVETNSEILLHVWRQKWGKVRFSSHGFIFALGMATRLKCRGRGSWGVQRQMGRGGGGKLRGQTTVGFSCLAFFEK